MNRIISVGFIWLLMLILLAGICTAAENPSYIVYIQGGESVITLDPPGMILTVQDVIPYFHKSDNDKEGLFPLERLTSMIYPVNAALVFTGPDNRSTSMVEISNLSLSDDNEILTLYVTPLKFYEGELLKSFTNTQGDLLGSPVGDFKTTQIYAEIPEPVAENDCDYIHCCWHGWEWCCKCPH